MNETLKRALSGAVYVAIMWFGTSYSDKSFIILFGIIGLICNREMGKLTIKFSYLYILLSSLYVLTPILLVFQLNRELVLFMFILTWTFDTFAYLFGVKFGKHKIMPSISPKKSWEGFAGGFTFTILASYLSYSYFEFESFQEVLIISIILPFTATLGDFIESYYKRKAGVKDSGSFIPGHGGMLDRMDAFMITIPVLYILTKLL